VIGGMPQGGLDFGAAVNTQALCTRTSSSTSTTAAGSIWPASGWPRWTARQRQRQPLRPALAGSGGFINISQNARKLVFAGTFTAGGLEVAIEDGRVRIAARAGSASSSSRCSR
jgi:propionate CoA-transferase